MDEFQIIAKYLKPLAAGMPAALDLSDDAAVITPPPGCDLVVTKDAMVGGVHFLPNDPPELIARKLLRVNLSDLGAMGATGYGYLLATAWPRDITEDWIAGFAAGLAADQDLYGVGLLGGDTVSTDGPLTLSLTAVGTVAKGKAVKRSGAEVGDQLVVTGTIGDAWVGLQVLQGHISVAREEEAILAYRLPDPPTTLGAGIGEIAHAAVDISDGLIADLGHLTEASGVGASVAVDALPLSDASKGLLAEGRISLKDLITGGDDYQLLMAVPDQKLPALEALAEACDVQVSAIGEIVSGSGIALDGEALDTQKFGAGGYRHSV